MLGISGKKVKNYQVIDVFDGTNLGVIGVNESMKILVNPTGNIYTSAVTVVKFHTGADEIQYSFTS